MSAPAFTPGPGAAPWCGFDNGVDTGFGFGAPDEWGEPLFTLYNGTPEQITDVVAKLNAHDELVAALRAAEARLNQPVFNNTESAGHQAANILRADMRSALCVIRAALARAQGGAK